MIAVKLNHGAARLIAKTYAPCKVLTIQADKSPRPNNLEYLRAPQR